LQVAASGSNPKLRAPSELSNQLLVSGLIPCGKATLQNSLDLQ